MCETEEAYQWAKVPQKTGHWSKYHPVFHVGPIDDCERCESDRIKYGAVL